MGSWDLTIELSDNEGEINDSDREHIAELIKQGFTSGDIVHEQ